MASDFILSLRIKDERGPQRNEIFEEQPPIPGLTWVIFIHGFKTSREGALEQWEQLRPIIGVDYGDSRIQAGLLLWPSDESRLYPKMIDYAEKAGRKLGSYLEKHPGSPAVLLGYSMGARVAIEAADYQRGAQLRAFVLLGAAVGVSQFNQFERYDRTHARREAVGFSPTDRVLNGLFTYGEKAAAPFSERGDAVGLSGYPESRTWHRRDSKTNDHSYYRLQVSGELTQWALDSAGLRRRPAKWIAAKRYPDGRDV
jgi:pimeloyl-ACP methyl ester carboxylesterase